MEFQMAFTGNSRILGYGANGFIANIDASYPYFSSIADVEDMLGPPSERKTQDKTLNGSVREAVWKDWKNGVAVSFQYEQNAGRLLNVAASCSPSEDVAQTEEANGYEPRKWLGFYSGEEMPWDSSLEISLPEYPSTVFKWTSEKITAIDANGEKELFSGIPIWNVYIANLTGDGLPEFCATVSRGSGIVDTHVIVYDYARGQKYELSRRTFLFNYTMVLIIF
jgi:hypothetical protein